MQRFIRPVMIAALLGTILFTGSAVVKISTAHACGPYQVPGSSTSFFESIPQENQDFNVTLTLWYSNCTGDNWAEMNITTGPATHVPTVFVHRLKGPDGGDMTESNFNCPNIAVCDSPHIHSPNNKSQACIQDPFTILCTDFF